MIEKLLAGTAFALVSASAFAADLPVRSAASAPVFAAAPFSWSGFYAGGSVGFAQHANGYRDIDSRYNGYGVGYNTTSTGAVFGAQAGYNFVVGSNILLGVEVDAQYNTGSANVILYESTQTYVDTKANWMTTARLRAGVVYGRALLYATGGIAYGNPDSNWVEGGKNPNDFSRDGWKAGWVAGLGVEYAITNNWTVRAEGLYYSLGNNTILNAADPTDGYRMKVSNDQIAVKLGVNYKFGEAADLAGQRAAASPVFAAGAFDWSGFYVGGSAGFAQHANGYTDLDVWYNATNAGYNTTSTGAVFGAQAGYNFLISSRFLLGLEVDGQYNTGSAKVYVNAPNELVYVDTKANWMTTARLRAGVVYNRALLYATGGVAYGNPDSTWYEGGLDGNFSRDGWKVGWVAGLGVEYAITNNWTVRAEGLYYDLGSKTVLNALDPTDGYRMKVSNEQIAVKLGVNYKFGGGSSAPVVARY